ncbi:hypothetical protein LTR86_009863 [Recurvomyces mirabilis]|nr:hypothetical protein LTR86_009863 [Recurvomyces mirabilis]
MLSSIFIYALDSTIVADLVPAIVSEFQDVSGLPWLSVGFSVGSLALVMPFGKLYGLFDAKWLYIISTVTFLASSALCGAAPSMSAEIVGRVLAGAGGNGMYLGVLTLLSVNTNDRERPFYLGLTGLIWGVGTVLGPVVGGGLEKVSWRWAFYINPIIGVVFMPAYLFLLPNFKPSTGTIRSKLQSLDWLGILLSIGGFISIIMAISFGGLLYDWRSSEEITLFTVTSVTWFFFFIQQATTFCTSLQDRVFPLDLLVQKEVLMIFFTMASGAAAGLIGIYYIPLYFQFTRGDNAIEAAVRLLPYLCLFSTFVLLNGALLARLRYYKPWYVGGSALALLGGVLLARIQTDSSIANIYGYEVLVATGVGAYAQAGYAVAQAILPARDGAGARTLIMIAQQSGIGFGLAISNAVFLNVAQSKLAAVNLGIPPKQVQELVTGTSATLLSSLGAVEKGAVLNALVASMRTT